MTGHTDMRTIAALGHDGLLAVLREQLPDCPPVKREALRLLLDYDNGVWFTDRDFVARVVSEAYQGADGHPVQMNFDELARCVHDARRAPAWSYRHGALASGILWLACELVGGRLQELSANSDRQTNRLISDALNTATRTLFQHGDPAG
jgi:hypothetical protein